MSSAFSDMSAKSLTVDEFLVWAEGRSGRYELVDGRVHATSPERLRHARTKFEAALALREAVRRAALPCEVLPDGVTVRVDPFTAYEPDALVRCGPPLDGDDTGVPDPLIVVEVLSPNTRNYDTGAKLAGYFSLPSVHHYLIIDPDRLIVVHHRRSGEAIDTRIHTRGTVIRLDPPGVELGVVDMLPAS